MGRGRVKLIRFSFENGKVTSLRSRLPFSNINAVAAAKNDRLPEIRTIIHCPDMLVLKLIPRSTHILIKAQIGQAKGKRQLNFCFDIPATCRYASWQVQNVISPSKISLHLSYCYHLTISCFHLISRLSKEGLHDKETCMKGSQSSKISISHGYLKIFFKSCGC